MLKLIVVQAEFGDCLLLQSSACNPISILIDGGPSQTYEKNLKPTLDKVIPSKNLDLVILSHIDNDHVLGLLDLFQAVKREKNSGGSEALKVSNLWHNSFSDLISSNPSKADKLMRNIFSSNQFFAIGNDNKMGGYPALSALKGISEGRDLTKLAQDLNIPINSQFGGDLIIAKKDDTVIKLQNLNFHILGPTQKSLDKLKEIWEDWEKDHLQAEGMINDYNLLQALDSSVTNLSSIMFLVESEGKRILFTGDGLGKNILDVLSEQQLLNSEGRLHVDILKVPHHGSERNVTRQFFETVTADVYVISADGRDDNPSFPTLKWIVEAKRKESIPIKVILTNRTTNTDEIQRIYDPSEFLYSLVFLNESSKSISLEIS